MIALPLRIVGEGEPIKTSEVLVGTPESQLAASNQKSLAPLPVQFTCCPSPVAAKQDSEATAAERQRLRRAAWETVVQRVLGSVLLAGCKLRFRNETNRSHLRLEDERAASPDFFLEVMVFPQGQKGRWPWPHRQQLQQVFQDWGQSGSSKIEAFPT